MLLLDSDNNLNNVVNQNFNKLSMTGLYPSDHQNSKLHQASVRNDQWNYICENIVQYIY